MVAVSLWPQMLLHYFGLSSESALRCCFDLPAQQRKGTAEPLCVLQLAHVVMLRLTGYIRMGNMVNILLNILKISLGFLSMLRFNSGAAVAVAAGTS